MKNVTIALDENLLAAGRAYARAHSTSLNNIIRESLQRTLAKESRPTWAREFLAEADKIQGDSRGKKWKREDLYRV